MKKKKKIKQRKTNTWKVLKTYGSAGFKGIVAHCTSMEVSKIEGPTAMSH